MATIEQAVGTGPLVRPHGRAEGAARARARVRREGDPAEGGRVRRALDPPGRRDREGARARADEPPRARGARRPRRSPRSTGCSSARSSPGAAPGSAPRSPRTASAPARSCSPARRSRRPSWLPPLLEEPLLCSFGLSEPDAGSDVARMKTTAVRRGDEYVLNGSKTFITNAGHAAWTVVFAKTDPSKGHRGISAFVVPMDAAGRDDREAPRQDGPALDRHVRVRAHRRRRPGREPARRGGRRLQDRDADARLHAARARRRARSASRRPRTSSRSTTRRSASPSTSRSRCTRASTS